MKNLEKRIEDERKEIEMIIRGPKTFGKILLTIGLGVGIYTICVGTKTPSRAGLYYLVGALDIVACLGWYYFGSRKIAKIVQEDLVDFRQKVAELGEAIKYLEDSLTKSRANYNSKE